MNKKFKKSIWSNQAGLTLVESLVAISVLVVGVLGPLNLASRGISDGIYSKNQIAATYLAQEAMEAIVNIRNTNQEREQAGLTTNWLDGIEDGTIDCIPGGSISGGSSDCFVDIATLSLGLATGPNFNEAKLQYCPSLFSYVNPLTGCTDESGPVFTRRAIITEVVNNREIKVRVEVTWSNSITQPVRKFEVVNHLFHRIQSP